MRVGLPGIRFVEAARIVRIDAVRFIRVELCRANRVLYVTVITVLGHGEGFLAFRIVIGPATFAAPAFHASGVVLDRWGVACTATVFDPTVFVVLVTTLALVWPVAIELRQHRRFRRDKALVLDIERSLAREGGTA